MHLLSCTAKLSRQTINHVQATLSKELAEDYFGSSTTFVAAEIDQTTGQTKIISVGDSRAYLIDTQGTLEATDPRSLDTVRITGWFVG